MSAEEIGMGRDGFARAGEMPRRDLDAILGFGLTDEQWAAVSAPLAPAVIVAGAGSGKTTSMAARVAWLVGSGLVAPDRVLGLTFTNKATAQLLTSMRAALAKLPPGTHIADADEVAGSGRLLGPDPSAAVASADPVVSTYNAFTSRVIAEHGIRIGLEPNARLLAEGQRHQLAYRLVCRSRLPLGRVDRGPGKVTSLLLDLDDELSNLDVRPADLIAFDDDLLRAVTPFLETMKTAGPVFDTAEQRRILAGLVVEWRQDKRQRDVVDFADQTRLALELVREFPDVALAVRGAYDVVLLDEYQDTAIAQRQFMQAVFGDGHPLTAVGDPCQAIYGWRGASVDNIESFTTHFDFIVDGAVRTPERYSLSENRRSGARILEVANVLSADLRAQHTGVQRLIAANDAVGPGVVRCGLFMTSDDEQRWLTEAIAEIGRGEPFGDVTVLASTKEQLRGIESLLRERGVPTQLHGAAGLLDHPVVVELRSLIEAAYRPVQNPAVIRLLAGARWRIGPRDIAALGRRAGHLAGHTSRARSGQEEAETAQAPTVEAIMREAVAGDDPVEAVSLVDALFDPGAPDAYSPEAYERIGALAAQLRALRRHLHEPVTEVIARAVRLTGLDIELAARADDVGRGVLAAFVEVAAELAPVEGAANLGAFLALLDDADRFEVSLPVDLPHRPDAVQLMTVHSAKGLEFEHVFVPAVSKGTFPGGKARPDWLAGPAVVPWELRPDAPRMLLGFPPEDGPRDKHIKAYKTMLADLRRSDDDRLMYVALTRAKRSLTVTGHWWGPSQKKPRGPEPYLVQVKEVCDAGGGSVVMWVDGPGEENPSAVAETPALPWPAAVASAPVLREVATRVRAAMVAPPSLPGIDDASLASALDPAERALVARWDLDIEALIAREQAMHGEQRIALPTTSSTSLLMRALRDPDAVAVELARPMPRQPSAAARRGTRIHLAIERHYGAASLLDPDDIPGAADDEPLTDEAVLEAIRGFERSPYADRQPVAVEEPFAIAVGGRLVVGKIDAVFRDGGGRDEVVDWKSGSATHVDAAQLVVYRAAWARRTGVAETDVDASFVMLATGEVVRPDLPTLDDLLASMP